jgi:rhodanese-related sulfurtransferase
MPHVITRDELQQLLTQGAQLVEVLPANEFEEEHLSGAVNIQLRRLDKEARAALDPAQPVVVYCWDVA